MINMIVPIVNKSNHRLPEYAHPGDAGFDLKANTDNPVVLYPMDSVVIPTGIYCSSPKGYYFNIKGRSGLSKRKILVMEGVIDQYTGEWGVTIINLGSGLFTINPGDRIAQAILTPYETVEWKEVRELEDTERGANGFGSSGID